MRTLTKRRGNGRGAEMNDAERQHRCGQQQIAPGAGVQESATQEAGGGECHDGHHGFDRPIQGPGSKRTDPQERDREEQHRRAGQRGHHGGAQRAGAEHWPDRCRTTAASNDARSDGLRTYRCHRTGGVFKVGPHISFGVHLPRCATAP